MPTLTSTAFNPIDLTALSLGAREGTLALRGLPGLNVLVRAAEMLTGLRYACPLGNPRLEALRTAAAKVRRGRRLEASEEAALATLGLSSGETRALLDRISGRGAD